MLLIKVNYRRIRNCIHRLRHHRIFSSCGFCATVARLSEAGHWTVPTRRVGQQTLADVPIRRVGYGREFLNDPSAKLESRRFTQRTSGKFFAAKGKWEST